MNRVTGIYKSQFPQLSSRKLLYYNDWTHQTHHNIETDDYIGFWDTREDQYFKGDAGEYRPFSMMYQQRLSIQGVEYNCAMQFVVAYLAYRMKDQELLERVMGYKDPEVLYTAYKYVSQQLSYWHTWKKNLIFYVNLHKFSQSKEMRDLILSTGLRKFVFKTARDKDLGVWYGPAVWRLNNSVLQNPREESKLRCSWEGHNHLGMILSYTRQVIKEDRVRVVVFELEK